MCNTQINFIQLEEVLRWLYLAFFALCSLILLHLYRVSIHHMLLFISRFIGILSIHMSNNTPKTKEFQYFYQALLEILYF